MTHMTQDMPRTAELQQMILEKEMLTAKLNRAMRLQEQFFRLASHQMQHPIGVIRGYLDLYLQHPKAHFRDILVEETDKLSQLLNRMLTYVRCVSGELKLSRETVDLRDFVQEIWQKFAQKHPTKFTWSWVPIASDYVVAMIDRFYLEEALGMVLENAIKYVPEGQHIWVGVRMKKGSSTEAEVLITDTGQGIVPHVLQDLFSPFVQGDHQGAGAGLGLTLCQKIIEAHGGTVECKSRVQKGTQFILTLPVIPE